MDGRRLRVDTTTHHERHTKTTATIATTATTTTTLSSAEHDTHPHRDHHCQHQEQRPPTHQRPSPMLAALVLLGCWWPQGCLLLASGQCLPSMMTSFERITSVTVKGSPLVSLYNAALNSPTGSNNNNNNNTNTNTGTQMAMAVASQLMSERQLTGGSPSLAPITAECNNRCRKSTRCRAFLVDYDKHACYGVEHQQTPQQQQQSSGAALARSPPPIVLVASQERTSYFEKICLNIPVVACDRAWLFERVLSYQIVGYDDKIIDDVQNRLKCQELCLNERDFQCRSGEYDYINMQCRLSQADRHSRPDSFRPAPSNIDYFENQCVASGAQCDTFDRFDHLDLGRAEILRPASTAEQCQAHCTSMRAFVCRSFTFEPLAKKCYLNSDDSLTVGGLDRLVPAPGYIYHQRSDCLDMRLDCEPTAMTLQLRTQEPFKGRIYVKDDPLACETMGRATTTNSLTIPFAGQSRCVTRDDRGKYSSVVVVQHHPMIQRKSDRYVKVVCDFQTSNRTISNSYNVLANLWASTALVNATSTAPQIMLRITDKYGADIAGAKLGDELFLRIEAKTDSVFDMVARSVLAKSGTTDESIMLIDKDGCPTDLRIFPELKKLNKRTLIGKFDAFKFSSDVVVRFQVDVQFCLNQCPQVVCDHQQNANGPSNMLFTTNGNSLEPADQGAALLPDLYVDQSAQQQLQQVDQLSQQQQQQQHQHQHQNQQPSLPVISSSPAPTATISNLLMGAETGLPSLASSDFVPLNSTDFHEPADIGLGAGHHRQQRSHPPHRHHGHRRDRNYQAASSNRRRRQAGEQHEATARPGGPGLVNGSPMLSTDYPLHREIIVESGPPATPPPSHASSKRHQQQPNQSQQQQHHHNHQQQQQQQPQRTVQDSDYDDDQPANGGSSHYQGDTSQLFCTTRYSLVLASAGFCLIQSLSVILCLGRWIYKRKRFQVKHHIDERLY